MTTFRAAAVLAARPGVPGDRFEQAVRDYRKQLAAKAGEDAVTVGVALPADPDEEQFGFIAPLDGFVQVTLSDRDELLSVFQGAAAELADVVDAQESVVVAGEARLVQSYPGKLAYAMVFRRAAGIGEQELSAWWTKHGEIPMAVLGGQDFGYEQLHGRDELTAALATATGFTDAGFGLFETMSADDVDALTARFDQATIERALADEQGYLDRTGMRGHWTALV